MKRAILVTGVNVGNGGYVIAERFAREGWDVFVTSRKAQLAAEAAKKLQEDYGVFAKGYQLLFRDEPAVEKVFAEIDGLGRFVETVCLNAADLGASKDPAAGMNVFETDIEEFQKVIDTNVVWNFMIVRQAALRMRKEQKGAIVFIGSNTALRPNPNRVAYIASKGGINSMSRALAVDLGPFGIRSNVVMPGTIKTQRWTTMGNRQITNGEMVPLGDISDFEDIANAVWFLGTEQSKNISGTELVIDGAMSVQLYPQLLNDLKRERLERNGMV